MRRVTDWGRGDLLLLAAGFAGLGLWSWGLDRPVLAAAQLALAVGWLVRARRSRRAAGADREAGH